MPRPDRPLSPDADPVQRLAGDLRKLRDQAGSPTYQALARKTQTGPDPRSSTTLSDAAGGQTCPSWATVAAFVAACGGRPGEWHERWRQAQLWRPGDATAPPADPAAEQTETSDPTHVDATPAADPPATPPATPAPSPDPTTAHEPIAPSVEKPPTPTHPPASDPDTDRPQPPRRDRRVLVGVGALVAAAILGTTGVVWYLGPTRVSGTVTCADDGAVVGVWVKAEEGDSGYASYLQRTDPAKADFHYRLSERTTWTVNVGCGGTTQDWLHQVHGVTMTSSTGQDWVCDSNRAHYGCRPA